LHSLQAEISRVVDALLDEKHSCQSQHTRLEQEHKALIKEEVKLRAHSQSQAATIDGE